jgi:RNA polymerase sigma-70 factor (ECF subfamily)
VLHADFEPVLDAARQGDELAFVKLFRSLQPALLRYLRAVGGPLADDVAADTWVSVVRNLDRFRGDEQGWWAWVFTIARARLRDEQRRSMRRPVPVDTDVLLASQEDATDVFGRVDEILTTEAALAFLGRLPPEQAEVVLLRHVVGLDVEHTARIVGKRPGTVRVTAHRALKRLADLLPPGASTTTMPSAVTAGNAIRHANDK